MSALTLRSPAKVNLTLDVLGRDEATGYHFVQTVLHEVPALCDELTFELRPGPDITLETFGPALPSDNTILMAARLLQAHARTSRGAHITLTKNIPLGSGLGGPASNAATALKALNQLWNLGFSDHTLREFAVEIGMDVPFFITGGCAIAMHYGEQLEHLPTLDIFGFGIEIIQTGITVSTRDAYAALDRNSTLGARNRDTGRLVAILKKKAPPTPDELEEIPRLLHNDFELPHSTSPKVHLSGSGGARFRLVRLA